tara:strand:- start:434 stop:772 length:339 start_codon:yes stop_codon:yes gene_type:complete
MNDLTNLLNELELNTPNDILLNIINHDFNILADLYIRKDTNICIEPEPSHEYYLTPDNCKIICSYLCNNYNGYNLLKHKISENILTKRFNIIINENDVQTYVDYYIDSLSTE